MNVVTDFPGALKEFPKHIGEHLLGLLYAWITVFDDLLLLVGSLLITSKNRRFKGLGLYSLLWLYFRRPR